MISLSSLYSNTLKRFCLSLRKIAYLEMYHQASTRLPEELRTEKKTKTPKPLQLNFNIPKKNRLLWISRTLQQ